MNPWGRNRTQLTVPSCIREGDVFHIIGTDTWERAAADAVTVGRLSLVITPEGRWAHVPSWHPVEVLRGNEVPGRRTSGVRG